MNQCEFISIISQENKYMTSYSCVIVFVSS
jgi:hypothetical protein